MHWTAIPLALILTAPLSAQERTVAFTNVSVIPMDRERVLEDQTVVVRGDRIAEIGPAAAIRAPVDSVRVDGRGKDALATATRNVAAYFGTTDSIGTVARGKVADLVLLDANPLADITNTTRISGVIARGVWVSRADIDRRLAEIAGGH